MRRHLAIAAALVALLAALWFALQPSAPPSTPRLTEPPVQARRVVAQGKRRARRAAAPSPRPSAQLSPPIAKRFRFRGQSQPIVARDYAPPFVLPTVSREAEAEQVKTVEGALASMHSAMAAGDFDRWFELWHPDSRAFMQGRWAALDTQQGLDSQRRLVSLWEQFRSAHWRLTRRFEIPGYVLVDVQTDAEGWVSPLAVLRFDGGRWWLSQDLYDSPLPIMALLGDEVQLDEI